MVQDFFHQQYEYMERELQLPDLLLLLDFLHWMFANKNLETKWNSRITGYLAIFLPYQLEDFLRIGPWPVSSWREIGKRCPSTNWKMTPPRRWLLSCFFYWGWGLLVVGWLGRFCWNIDVDGKQFEKNMYFEGKISSIFTHTYQLTYKLCQVHMA